MKVIVVGGGAAGMMAALTAAGEGREVLLLEKNEKLGKKIYITGKGRCNYSNAAPVEEALSMVVSNRKFLYSAFYGLPSESVTALLNSLGCPTKEERGKRLFPLSDHASDVTKALETGLKRAGVRVRLSCAVTGLEISDGRVTGVRTREGVIGADHVILATGGLSYPTTGSTGDGHRMASETGHTVTPMRPALVPIETAEDWCADLQGLSLRNTAIRVKSGKRVLYEDFGEMMFTHFGVTGPMILSTSSIVGKELEKGPLRLEIDLKPALTEETLDERLKRELTASPRRGMKNVAGSLYPSSLVPVMLSLAGIPEEKCAGDVTKEERRRLLSLTKCLPLTLTALRGYREAVITQGGVSVRDIDPHTMRSKKVEGLSFAGEMIDVDAFTGGFNLQIAWSTGNLAGKGL